MHSLYQPSKDRRISRQRPRAAYRTVQYKSLKVVYSTAPKRRMRVTEDTRVVSPAEETRVAAGSNARTADFSSVMLNGTIRSTMYDEQCRRS